MTFSIVARDPGTVCGTRDHTARDAAIAQTERSMAKTGIASRSHATPPD